jgi:CYTH domain-containing protein
LRLREVTETDGTVVRKLGHKVRLGVDAREVACTSLYLDDAEWAALCALPGDVLTKLRVFVPHGELTVALDVFEPPYDGLVLAEIDSGDRPDGGPDTLSGRFDVVREVTDDEAFTGAALARRAHAPSGCPGTVSPDS